MRAFGASDASLSLAEDYAFWMFVAALANLPAQSMNCAARAESSVKISSIAVITGALLNVVLDPIFMFDWGLGMGVEGALCLRSQAGGAGPPVGGLCAQGLSDFDGTGSCRLYPAVPAADPAVQPKSRHCRLWAVAADLSGGPLPGLRPVLHDDHHLSDHRNLRIWPVPVHDPSGTVLCPLHFSSAPASGRDWHLSDPACR